LRNVREFTAGRRWPVEAEDMVPAGMNGPRRVQRQRSRRGGRELPSGDAKGFRSGAGIEPPLSGEDAGTGG
jgi:hypothetical protein